MNSQPTDFDPRQLRKKEAVMPIDKKRFETKDQPATKTGSDEQEPKDLMGSLVKRVADNRK